MVSVALFMAGCGRLCDGGTPVEDFTCTQQGTATLSSTAISSGPVALTLEGAETSIAGHPFSFLFVGGYLNLQISSSFRAGAGAYVLPSPAVTVQASILLQEAGYQYEELHVASGTITVAAANQNVLDASGALTLTDDSGRTFTVADMTVHIACAYDETVCR
jgi:hypothetical protein